MTQADTRARPARSQAAVRHKPTAGLRRRTPRSRVLAGGPRCRIAPACPLAPARRPGGRRKLTAEIRRIHARSRGTYGAPRVTVELGRRGWKVNHKRVERLLRCHGIAGYQPRRRRSLTKQDSNAAPAPDLLGRLFDPDHPDVAWCGDVTYIPTDEGWLYLASVLDLASRHLLGYSMSTHHDAALVVGALDAAVATRGHHQPATIIHGRITRCPPPGGIPLDCLASDAPATTPRLAGQSLGSCRPSWRTSAAMSATLAAWYTRACSNSPTTRTFSTSRPRLARPSHLALSRSSRNTRADPLARTHPTVKTATLAPNPLRGIRVRKWMAFSTTPLRLPRRGGHASTPTP
jgi:hypothetical protein